MNISSVREMKKIRTAAALDEESQIAFFGGIIAGEKRQKKGVGLVLLSRGYRVVARGSLQFHVNEF